MKGALTKTQQREVLLHEAQVAAAWSLRDRYERTYMEYKSVVKIDTAHGVVVRHLENGMWSHDVLPDGTIVDWLSPASDSNQEKFYGRDTQLP
jgi:hypothetical protein